MIQKIGIVKESPEDTIVALTPDNVHNLSSHFDILIERDAGLQSGYTNKMYQDAGATIIDGRENTISESNIIVSFRSHIALDASHPSKTIIGCHPVRDEIELLPAYMNRNVSIFSLDLLPRTSIAQSMDVLTSLASISGYQAVISGMDLLPKVTPMITGAGGTLQPAKVLVLGAGVAGLQAIATAHRMGAIVHAFDVRKQTQEQVESLGAKFINIEGSVESTDDEGYAREQKSDFNKLVQEKIESVIPTFDIVVCTAKIPGKKAPVLITQQAVKSMKKNSVIIDLAASTGGNCEVPDTFHNLENNVTIIKDSYLFNAKPESSSILLGKNIENFIHHFHKNSSDIIHDPILQSTLVMENGQIVNQDLIKAINTII